MDTQRSEDLARAAPPPVGDLATAGDTGADGERQPFVTFGLHREHFALPMTVVREIIRVPEVVRVPLAPAALEGLANLRGQMLPVISLRRALRFAPLPYDSATRVVVVEEEQGGGIVGFVVDHVLRVLTVRRGEIEAVGPGSEGVDAALLRGIIRGAGEQPLTMLLDLSSLLRSQHSEAELRALPAAPARARRGPERSDRTDRGDRDDHSDAGSQSAGGASASVAISADAAGEREHHLVSFQIAQQEYAFPIAHVREIVQFPAQLTQIPRAAAGVLGVMTLRDLLLPLVSLRQLFGLPFEPLGTQHRIVVIDLPADQIGGAEKGRTRGGAVGMVMDRVNEVLRVPAPLCEPLPDYLRQQEHGAELAAICRLDSGKRLVGILSVPWLLGGPAVQAALSAASADSEGEQDQDKEDPMSVARAAGPGGAAGVEGGEDEVQLVVFRLDGQEYGVPIDDVQEIIRVPESITPVPSAPSALVGVVNVRGLVLPVVDLRARFSLPRVPRDDRQRIILFAPAGQSAGGARTGFIVDVVLQVLKLARTAIEDLPDRSGRNPLITQVVNLPAQKRMVLLLDARGLQSTTPAALLPEGADLAAGAP